MPFLEYTGFQEETVLHIFGTLKLGKAGGDDAVLAECLRALSCGQKLRLASLLRGILFGTGAIPPTWRRACDSLIPKISDAILPGHFRPITVFHVLMKTAMRLWMHEIRDYMGLHRRSSHGFRASFQAFEVHLTLRMLVSKRAERGSTTRSCKLDIRKAYDIVAWEAISRVCSSGVVYHRSVELLIGGFTSTGSSCSAQRMGQWDSAP